MALAPSGPVDEGKPGERHRRERRHDGRGDQVFHRALL
jgi:hypothetical protein